MHNSSALSTCGECDSQVSSVRRCILKTVVNSPCISHSSVVYSGIWLKCAHIQNANGRRANLANRQ